MKIKSILNGTQVLKCLTWNDRNPVSIQNKVESIINNSIYYQNKPSWKKIINQDTVDLHLDRIPSFVFFDLLLILTPWYINALIKSVDSRFPGNLLLDDTLNGSVNILKETKLKN